ncbi:MAG TPA: LPS assembly protein LptD [Steroidobacteraceae bacterium]|nr:LPS assembly protein LptD [Steroidobacteraceae bacterium]
MLLLAFGARADDPVCPKPAVVTGAPPPPTIRTDPSKEPVTLDFDDKNFTADVNGNVVASGNVVMRQGDRKIRTDHIEYDAQTSKAKLEGGIEYTDPQLIVRGNSGTYSPTLGTSFEGTEFELPERNARGAARSMQVDANNKVTLDEVSFTTCPVEDLAWQMKAKRIELDTRERVGTGRGAQVRFKGVPIIYLPYISFPIGPQRKSGFLFPDIGASSRSGPQVVVPYYWNIRPNFDFTAEPVYYSRRGLDLAGETRFLTARQRGTLSWNYLPSDDLAGIDRHRVQLAHVAELPGEWRFRIDATDVSDSDYFEDFAQGPEGTSVAFAERLAEATYRDEHLNVRAQLQQFQTIDDELPDVDRPYARTPRVLASGDWDAGLGGIEYGFDAEYVNFDRNIGVTGWRLDVAPRMGFDWSAPGFFVRPSAGYRYTQYDLKNQAPGTDDSPTRSLPFATLDAGLVFERQTGSHGQRRLTLEPRALYLYTPFREQSELPLFDTGLPDLNLVELYRTNRYVGADRVNDANQVAFGLTSRVFNAKSGAQYLAVSVGQAYYFEKPRVVLPDEPPATRDTSDFIAQMSLTAYKNWNLEAGIQWNPEDTRSERSQFRLQYRPDGDHVVNLAYRTQRDRLEQADVSTAWSIGNRWNAFGRVVYSLRDSETLDRFAGFEFKACCYRLRAVARRFISSRTGEQDTGFYIQLELNGLASVGIPVDAFLERTIRGYSPETSAR